MVLGLPAIPPLWYSFPPLYPTIFLSNNFGRSSIRGEFWFQPIKCPHLAGWFYMLPAYSLKLMNGTRCIITQALPNVIQAEIRCRRYKEEKHWIPRITLQPSDSGLPFTFNRKQFPLRPCFSLTINKAQGQSLKVVGLDLSSPVFSHGMLYAALPRTGNPHAIHILAPNSQTRNVVYSEVLDSIPHS